MFRQFREKVAIQQSGINLRPILQHISPEIIEEPDLTWRVPKKLRKPERGKL